MLYFSRKIIQNVLENIKRLSASKFIIAIDGPGGSGKSTLAEELLSYLPGAFTVHMDDFYKPKYLREEPLSKTEIGGYFDWERIEKQIIIPFAENRDIKYQKYNWQFDSLNDWVLIPKSSNVIVEGIYSSRKELSHYYNLKIWIECPPDVRLSRGIERDGIEMKEYWQKVWMKQENDYFEKQEPFKSANIIISNS